MLGDIENFIIIIYSSSINVLVDIIYPDSSNKKLASYCGISTLSLIG